MILWALFWSKFSLTVLSPLPNAPPPRPLLPPKKSKKPNQDFQNSKEYSENFS